jgi:uncharacterized protein (TIGR04255 family)
MSVSASLPKYDAPPVVETVLSVQFDRLPAFSSAHAGWFWKSALDPSWTKVTEVQRLDDEFERFGQERVWKQRAFQVTAVGKEPQRLQIVRSDEQRMIQVQDSRFIQNWRKKDEGYPSYGTLVPEFRKHFTSFASFIEKAALSPIVPNQWEVIYVNLIHRGDMWDSPRDWRGIFPWFALPLHVETFDTFGSGEWQFVIGDKVARLYVNLGHVKLGGSEDQAIRLQLLARGPVANGSIDGVYAGFDLGHEAIVTAFTAMTSDHAHKRWKRIS